MYQPNAQQIPPPHIEHSISKTEQPISSSQLHKQLLPEYKRNKMYRELMDYLECRGWELTDEDMGYINTLSYHQLEHLLMVNRGRNNFVIPSKRKF
jgi:hypothetical protein